MHLHQIYTVFSQFQTCKVDEYFTMAVITTQLSLKVVMPIEHFYGDYKTAPLKIKPGPVEYSVTFTEVERSNADQPNGQVRVYVNGVLSRTSPSIFVVSSRHARCQSYANWYIET